MTIETGERKMFNVVRVQVGDHIKCGCDVLLKYHEIVSRRHGNTGYHIVFMSQSLLINNYYIALDVDG